MALMFDRWVDRRDRKPLILLMLFFAVVAIAGGSSRADVLGQAVVRGAAVLLMIALVVARVRIELAPYKPIALILSACVVLILVQLVPLPPAIWARLPGHAMLVTATEAAGLPTPWRPIAIYPDGALNALFSLLVPSAALLGIAALGPRGVRQLLPILIGSALVCAVVILLQASGGLVSNPFINDAEHQAAGFFANRNHGALLLAIGTVAIAYWGFASRQRSPRQMLLAGGVMVLFLLTNLATGSRSGLVVELLALLAGLATTRALGRGGAASGWRRTLLPAGAALIVGAVIAISLSFDRAMSLDRIFGLAASDDARVQAAPTIWHLVGIYFPFGSGAGSFDQAFRIAEPFTFLDPSYMNHAHDDWLEIPLEYGLAGALILILALLWAARQVAIYWRRLRGSESALPRLGGIVVLLTAVAAVTDYAARTPIIMTVLVIAGAWLCAPNLPGWSEQFALRRSTRSL